MQDLLNAIDVSTARQLIERGGPVVAIIALLSIVALAEVKDPDAERSGAMDKGPALLLLPRGNVRPMDVTHLTAK